MRKIFCIITAVLTLMGCDRSATSANNNGQQDSQSKTDTVTDASVNQAHDSTPPGNLFPLPDAEKILGEEAHLTDSSSTTEEGVAKYNSSYTANSKDQKTGKTGVVYFVYEQYPEASSAHKVYSSIKTANENHGIKELHDLGDEAYFHSDGENFYFIMVRKGEKMFRIKVNKITSMTSLDDFNLVAKNITAAL